MVAAQPLDIAIVPAQQVQTAMDRLNVLLAIVNQMRSDNLKDGVDYGIIPGTGAKPTLLLPGMEKLMRALNAVPEYIERRVIVDYDRPLFHYEYECRLIEADTGLAIPGGRGLGLCTSYESAFRWREAKRKCPTCGAEAIIKGKAEYGGGWLCFKKQGGCGAKFPDGSAVIEDQTTGRIENPDIFDQVNAIMKRAKKRALGDAIKGAANVSEYFTVDLEDLPQSHITIAEDVVEGEVTQVTTTPAPAPGKPAGQGAWTFDDEHTITDLMFNSREWGITSKERMNTIHTMHGEGAFDSCATYAEAEAAFKARLQAPDHGKKKTKSVLEHNINEAEAKVLFEVYCQQSDGPKLTPEQVLEALTQAQGKKVARDTLTLDFDGTYEQASDAVKSWLALRDLTAEAKEEAQS